MEFLAKVEISEHHVALRINEPTSFCPTGRQVLLPGVLVHVAGERDKDESSARARLCPRGPQLGDGGEAVAAALLVKGEITEHAF